jgi:hypothetical protein
MKNKKRSALIILCTGLFLFGLQACEKYPDGPLFSLNSRTGRVSNTWTVDNYKVNGNDYTSLVSGYSETYTKSSDYSYQWGVFGGTGTWSFQNNDEEIRITGINNQESVTLFILKLEEKEFWYYIMDGDDRKEFHMIQQ